MIQTANDQLCFKKSANIRSHEKNRQNVTLKSDVLLILLNV